MMSSISSLESMQKKNTWRIEPSRARKNRHGWNAYTLERAATLLNEFAVNIEGFVIVTGTVTEYLRRGTRVAKTCTLKSKLGGSFNLKNLNHSTHMAKYKLEYIWLDGYEPVPNLRGKTQVKEFKGFPKFRGTARVGIRRQFDPAGGRAQL